MRDDISKPEEERMNINELKRMSQTVRSDIVTMVH